MTDLVVFGCMVLFMGIFLRRFPPDYDTERYWGYRTFRSLRDKYSWDKANRLAVDYLIKLAFPNILIGSFLTVSHLITNDSLITLVKLFFIIVTFILVIFLTERQL